MCYTIKIRYLYQGYLFSFGLPLEGELIQKYLFHGKHQYIRHRKHGDFLIQMGIEKNSDVYLLI